jgi:putative SOS response-associated peptidase YedK
VTEAELLEAYPVSTAVNSVQNNDPSLLEPIPEATQDSSADAQETLI